MYKITEEDRKAFLEYLGRKPYIEVAALIARIASWKREVPKDKNPVSFYYEKTILEKHTWKVLYRMFNTSLIVIEVNK